MSALSVSTIAMIKNGSVSRWGIIIIKGVTLVIRMSLGGSLEATCKWYENYMTLRTLDNRRF